jgi:hypothetical protein
MNQIEMPEKIIIRTWPKLIFLWPTAALALLAGCLQSFGFASSWANLLGTTFLLCFAFNLIVLAFDFPRSTSLTVFIAVVSVLLGVVLLNQQLNIIAPLRSWLGSLELNASRDFYLFIAVMMALIYVAMMILTRFDYWELTSNELVHHTGLLGDVERYSTAGLKLNTEIKDVFEYVLARSGRVIMNIPGNPRPIVLDNVLRIRKLVEQSTALLSRRVVSVAGHEHPHLETQKRAVTGEDET